MNNLPVLLRQYHEAAKNQRKRVAGSTDDNEFFIKKRVFKKKPAI